MYWNGAKVGESRSSGPPQSHQYVVPAVLVKAGAATLAVRIFSPAGNAGISPGSSLRAVEISLAGMWQAKNEFALPPLSAEAKAAIPPVPQQPFPSGMFFDYAVRSKIPYAIAGAIWYQGESNTERAWQYRTAFPLMIRDWREHWGQGDFPFYFCQLPNIMPHKPEPSESQWAELRERKLQALSLPNTGEAVLIDVGEEEDIHPRNKRTVGERLARIALAKTYGKKLVACGPMYESFRVEGDKIRVHFSAEGSSLVVGALPATYQPSSSFPRTVPLVRNSPHSEVEGLRHLRRRSKVALGRSEDRRERLDRLVAKGAKADRSSLRLGRQPNLQLAEHRRTSRRALPHRRFSSNDGQREVLIAQRQTRGVSERERRNQYLASSLTLRVSMFSGEALSRGEGELHRATFVKALVAKCIDSCSAAIAVIRGAACQPDCRLAGAADFDFVAAVAIANPIAGVTRARAQAGSLDRHEDDRDAFDLVRSPHDEPGDGVAFLGSHFLRVERFAMQRAF